MRQNPTLRILPTFSVGFLGYFAINLGVSVLPIFIHHDLRASPGVVGEIFALQYLSTLCTRGLVGRLSDAWGSQRATQLGLAFCVCSGILLAVAGAYSSSRLVAFASLVGVRILLGIAESFVSTSVSSWGIDRVGRSHVAHVLAWSGVGSYGSFALASPVGHWLYEHLQVAGLGAVICLSAVTAILVSTQISTPVAPRRTPQPVGDIFGKILPYGIILMLSSTGFSMLSSFVALYFEEQHWRNAAAALTFYGLSFVVVRLLFSGTVARLYPLRVACLSLLVEAVGLGLLAFAPNAYQAWFSAGLIGLGSSLVFPLLGAKALEVVGARDQATALSLYTAFISVAIGLTAVCGGILSSRYGFRSLYTGSAVCVLFASLLCLLKMRRLTPENRSGLS